MRRQLQAFDRAFFRHAACCQLRPLPPPAAESAGDSRHTVIMAAAFQPAASYASASCRQRGQRFDAAMPLTLPLAMPIAILPYRLRLRLQELS